MSTKTQTGWLHNAVGLAIPAKKTGNTRILRALHASAQNPTKSVVKLEYRYICDNFLFSIVGVFAAPIGINTMRYLVGRCGALSILLVVVSGCFLPNRDKRHNLPLVETPFHVRASHSTSSHIFACHKPGSRWKASPDELLQAQGLPTSGRLERGVIRTHSIAVASLGLHSRPGPSTGEWND
jgi:hypothetical protein